MVRYDHFLLNQSNNISILKLLRVNSRADSHNLWDCEVWYLDNIVPYSQSELYSEGFIKEHSISKIPENYTWDDVKKYYPELLI